MYVAPAHPRWLLAALALATLSGEASAQAPTASGQGQATPPWPAVQAGIRVGYDDNSSATVAGGQIRIPVVRGGWLELIPSADVTFLTGLREYQFNGDLAFVTGGARGGLYLGGGVVARNSIFEGAGRETRNGGSAVIGFTNRGTGDVPIGTQIELRWIFIDAPFDPRTLTFGVNLPLWGWGQPARGGRRP